LTKALVGLIVLATVAFAIGAAIEKSQHHSESTAKASAANVGTILINGRRALLASETPAEHAAESGGTTQPSPTPTGGTHSEAQHSGESAAGKAQEKPPGTSGESGAKHAGEGGGSETAATHASETHSEKLLGLNPEATSLVVAAVIASLLLALAIWFRPEQTLLFLLVAAAMLLFAALDIREAIHQSDESNSGLEVLASVIALLHLAAGGLALYLARLRSRARPA